jgi:peptidyl-dipeptidase Dcp
LGLSLLFGESSKEKYDLDQNVVKEYLQLENLREGMFWVAGELFDLQFKQITNVPVYHADVRVWEVSNKTTGKLVGLWYFDPYARKETFWSLDEHIETNKDGW